MNSNLEHRTERQIEDDLLDVLAAAALYLSMMDNNSNPFVRQIGTAAEEAAALKILRDCVENASYLTPQIEALMQERVANSQAEKVVKED